MRILLVEDDEILSNVLWQSLTSHNYVVDVAQDGLLGWEYIQSGEYELIVMDVGLPELDGISLCQKLRSKGYSTPVLLMTAKDANQERIRGLDAGADDYLIKPLDVDELHARIRALSRRGEVIPTAVLEVEGLRLDPSSCQVSYQDKPIKLTPKEYNLLELFLRNRARVFSRSQILDRIWTFDDPPLEESVKAHIKGLRKKLKQAGVVDWIENVYGIGYRFSPKLEQSQTNQTLSSSVEQEFNQKMEQMWQQYQGLMSKRLKILNLAATEASKARLSPDLHHSAAQAAHKLAGVLGMFARETGTQLAREIETLLQTNEVLSAIQREQLIFLVDDLSNLLALEESTATTTIINQPKLLLIVNNELKNELQQLNSLREISWHQVDNLETARLWLQENCPHLVVLDLETSSDSAQNLAFITELTKRTPSVKVLVISAEDQLAQRIAIARAGASGFLVKSFTAKEIGDTVTQLLQHSRQPHYSYQENPTTQILVVDDDPIFLNAIETLLEPWGMQVTTLDQPLRFWELMQKTKPDLLILDVEMPQINGIELCQAIRNDPNWQELPVFFLTAHRDAETIQQVFAVGADDYITKPLVGVELLARITNRLERNRWLQNLSTKDTLTGLMNQPQSNRALTSLFQNNQSGCLAVVSIAENELRQINLKYGHTMGNQVLQRWSNLLQTVFRQIEVLGYYGLGEFVLGTINLNYHEMRDRTAELATSLRKQVFTAPDGERFQVEFKIAIAQYPNHGDTLQALYQFCCQ
ncbi:response regulator [Stanieria cyanosphaera]|nr:response regulator [Stanieria cyanosphaera]